MLPIKVQIIPSLELQRLSLTDLVGRTAVIVEPIETPNGCWIRLDDTPYLDWSDWYIPYESLMFVKDDKLVPSIDIAKYLK